MRDHDHTAHRADAGAGESAGVWTCPMHPEVKSDQPGRCPKCRMFLVKAG